MKLPMFSIRDSALDAFMRPFIAPSTGLAMRSFADEVNRADSEMCKHPEDYELYQVGVFDEEAGLVAAVPLKSLARAVDVKK